MKRICGLLVPILLAGGALVAVPTAAQAADPVTLTVVGTSDVYDSNLVQSVIKPGFEAAYPQYTVNYVSKGTGAAIAYAKAGTADALLVHAASLENQFVADGYSLETAGRAIFWGDYVLLGPKSDPVGVKASAAHDIVKAFEMVAAAGEAGTANFVSRGGTPGTTVQEHAIWSETSGTTLCTVSTTDGGGSSPSTAAGNCGNPISYPSWYHATGLTQGPNIVAGDTCTFTGGNCYVLTDRGTFAYLQSNNQLSNLQIVTRDNGASAKGGITMLVNSFHAYAINPAKFPGVTIHSDAATLLLNWITSPAGQAAIGNFLPADPPFIPDAAPKVTITSAPTSPVTTGSPVKVTARLTNVVPGTPALSGVTVKLTSQADGATSVATVATGVTDASGSVTLSYTPSVNAIYRLTTDQLLRVEDATLNPTFSDILAPTTTVVGSVTVKAKITVTSAKAKKKYLTVKGKVYPKSLGTTGVVQFWASRSGALKKLATRKLAAGQSKYSYKFHLSKKGTWKYQLRYVNSHVVITANSPTKKVKIH